MYFGGLGPQVFVLAFGGAADVELMTFGWSMEVCWSFESRRVACELVGDMLKGALAADSSSPLGLDQRLLTYVAL
jgi:hypothetical protein